MARISLYHRTKVEQSQGVKKCRAPMRQPGEFRPWKMEPTTGRRGSRICDSVVWTARQGWLITGGVRRMVFSGGTMGEAIGGCEEERKRMISSTFASVLTC